MRIPFKELANRLNGVNIGPIGVSWTPTELEIEKARRVIAFCEDRRILFAPYNWEMKQESVDSATEIREFLTDELGKLERKSEFSKKLEVIRKACRTFLNDLRTYEIEHDLHEYNMVHGAPRKALDNLRKSCALSLLWIVFTFELDVEDDLAQNFQYAEN